MPSVFGDNNLCKSELFTGAMVTLCVAVVPSRSCFLLMRAIEMHCRKNWCLKQRESDVSKCRCTANEPLEKSRNKSLLKIRGYPHIHPKLTVLEPDWRQGLVMFPKLQELPIRRRPLNTEEIIYWGIHKAKWPVAWIRKLLFGIPSYTMFI